MPSPIYDALEKVCHHYGPEELKHYQSSLKEEQDGHIWRSLYKISKWLDPSAFPNEEATEPSGPQTTPPSFVSPIVVTASELSAEAQAYADPRHEGFTKKG